jgi:hypothetical protein
MYDGEAFYINVRHLSYSLSRHAPDDVICIHSTNKLLMFPFLSSQSLRRFVQLDFYGHLPLDWQSKLMPLHHTPRISVCEPWRFLDLVFMSIPSVVLCEHQFMCGWFTVCDH